MCLKAPTQQGNPHSWNLALVMSTHILLLLVNCAKLNLPRFFPAFHGKLGSVILAVVSL